MSTSIDSAGMGEATLTERGRRTREALIHAARQVFETRGYVETRLADISRAAGVSYGTFYTYFPSKESVFREVVERMLGDLSRRDPIDHELTPLERIDRANRAFFAAYKRNAKMMGILEQVATLDEDIRLTRRETGYATVNRTARAIRGWQAEGLVPRDIDPRYAASALGSMVDRSVYVWLVVGEPHDEEQAIATLNLLVARALGLPVAAPT